MLALRGWSRLGGLLLVFVLPVAPSVVVLLGRVPLGDLCPSLASPVAYLLGGPAGVLCLGPAWARLSASP